MLTSKTSLRPGFILSMYCCIFGLFQAKILSSAYTVSPGALFKHSTPPSCLSHSAVQPRQNGWLVKSKHHPLRARNVLPDDTDEEEKVETLEFTLKEHKPLGCTVEESLAPEADGRKPVFIAGLADGGNAGASGLKVGDVIVGLTGVFDDVIDVDGFGLERVRSLVAGRAPDQQLIIRVSRGTDVQARHEEVLVDLCTLPGGTDTTLDNCVNAIMSGEFSGGYEEVVENTQCEDDDTDCMVDAMYQMWGEDLPPTPKAEDGKDEDEKKENTKKPSPWSSRSSPSGTYVRNPKTGKMENIDA